MSDKVIFSEPLHRIRSIDTIRGVIMVIMALDHVRDFFHITAFTANPLNPETTSVFLFFTRWITHFCAPAFMLLSGISAHLAGRNRPAAETGLFLVKRGFWLVLVEVTVMTFALSFDVSYKFIFLNVFWALGTSMIVLGILVRFLPVKWILCAGLLLIFGHNLLDLIKLTPDSPQEILLTVLMTSPGRFFPVGGQTIAVLYVILPWAGVMMSGYGLGALYAKDFNPLRRKKILQIVGLGAICLFLIIRFLNGYGDPSQWTVQKEGFRTLLSFFNVSKYPPSLLFTLMTTGPVLLLLSFSDTAHNGFTRFVSVYGKVPFFYFVTHFFVIHILSAAAVLASGYTWQQATDPELFFKFRPSDFGYELGTVYLIWIVIVLALYQPCKWFGAYKMKHKKWWLRYL
jgi:uncharacterized membrane protein